MIHDETSNNLIADVVGDLSPLNNNLNNNQRANNNNGSRPLWSHQNANDMQTDNQNHQRQDDNEDDGGLAMLWPSQKNRQEQDDGNAADDMAGMWPSQKKDPPVKSSMAILKNKLSEPVTGYGESSDILDSIDDDSNATVGIVWPSVNTQ